MGIRIEFYGIPRQRTGVGSAEIDCRQHEMQLHEVLSWLAEQFPALSHHGLGNGGLQRQFAISVNGERFVSDPSVRIRSGETLLLMSADAGG